jgi:hypothetical protein
MSAGLTVPLLLFRCSCCCSSAVLAFAFPPLFAFAFPQLFAFAFPRLFAFAFPQLFAFVVPPFLLL